MLVGLTKITKTAPQLSGNVNGLEPMYICIKREIFCALTILSNSKIKQKTTFNGEMEEMSVSLSAVFDTLIVGRVIDSNVVYQQTMGAIPVQHREAWVKPETSASTMTVIKIFFLRLPCVRTRPVNAYT